MRFVRSTSVTLKVLKSHDSDVLWRVQLLSSAIVHLRTCHHERQERQWKSYLMLLFLKKQIQKKQKQKQKQHPNEPALNNTVLDSLRKEVRLLLVKKKHRVLLWTSPGLERSQRRDPRGGLQVSHWRHVRQRFQLENSQIGMATRTRDNIHKQTTFIFFSFLFKNM